MQDVIGRDVDDGPSRVRLLSWRELPRGVRTAVLVAAAAAGASAVVLARPGATPDAGDVRVVVEQAVVDQVGASATGRSVTGRLAVRVVGSAGDVEVSDVTLAARGLELLSVEPTRRAATSLLRYRVPDCGALRLPGELVVRLVGGSSHSRPVGRGAAPGDVAVFQPCPVGAVPSPALAVRPLDGAVETTATGAHGVVRLEVHNGGPSVRLLSVTAEVPGVRSSSVVPAHGAHLRQDERVEVVLRFEIEDCDEVLRTGRLVLRAVRDGVERELGLTLTHDVEARRLRQLGLDGLLDACRR